MDKIYVLYAPTGFKDGMITECPYVRPMGTVEVPEHVALKMMNSDTSLEHVDTLVPNPRKKTDDGK